MGITFGNVLSYNALLDMCARAANHKTSMYVACFFVCFFLCMSARAANHKTSMYVCVCMCVCSARKKTCVYVYVCMFCEGTKRVCVCMCLCVRAITKYAKSKP
jgi:hypothetical protein